MHTRTFEPIPHVAETRYVPGAAAGTWHPGDFILVHSDSFVARIVSFGERLRIHGDDRKYAWFTHSALVIGEHGELAEALGNGVVRSHADKYRKADYTVVETGSASEDLKQVLAFAEWVLRARPRYGWLEIASLAITLATGAKFTFFIDGEYICSGFVARAMERTGAIFSRDPVHVTPADLAKYYSAAPPG